MASAVLPFHIHKVIRVTESMHALLAWISEVKISRSMMTSSNGNIFCVTDHLCGEFTGPRWIPTQRPVTRSFDVYFDLRPNKRLSKQSWGWWFETLSRPLWRHRNATPLTWSKPWRQMTCPLTSTMLLPILPSLPMVLAGCQDKLISWYIVRAFSNQSIAICVLA